ncbi:MAG TPA: TetR/AcrR family transcriptional regulator [Streptomyces sp.]|jgi:AcrR family transcriptional regulator|nr:TetR/AcrR family transcriptional regulator [Streptomyces sp.]
MRKVDPVKHQERRQQIVGAAVSLFADKGFDRTTTAEICKAAGISTGNLFHYFPSKRAIFHAVFQEDGDDKADALARARTADDPWQALLEVVELLATPATEPLTPPLVMEAMVQAYRDPELDELLSRDNADEHAAVAHLLRRTADAGQTDPGLDPDDAATWVLALVATLYTSAATDPSFQPAGQLPMLRLILERYLRPGRNGQATTG